MDTVVSAAFALSSSGNLFGYTIANNAPSKKQIHTADCALGPGIVVRGLLPLDTTIEFRIKRAAHKVFSRATSLTQMQQPLPPFSTKKPLSYGCLILADTGISSSDDFTLSSGDEMSISITSIGTLQNTVA